jgi:DNA-binding winged helix-turn-helix (wHTH) protein
MVSQHAVGTNSYWATFPETYRIEQIATIAKWIAVGDSGVVVGGSGTGKSNLVGFFTTRPELVCHYLPHDPTRYLFLHMDVNSLPRVTTPYFYRGMLFAMQTAAAEIDPALAQQINQSMTTLMNAEDALGLHFVLQRAHDLLINHAQKQVVWIIDRFDEACISLESSTLNSLRNLRDHNRIKGNLSYILFTRHPLARLRNPREYDEFHEIIISNTCWVGPMVRRDSEWMARQMAERHQVTFNQSAVNLLIELSGGLPAFMKAACTALATGLLLPDESAYAWLDRLLEQQPIQRNCQEMWDDLLPAEKDTLSAIGAGVREEELDVATIQYLEQASLLARRQSSVALNGTANSNLRIFSPIFELFVIRQKVYVASGISLDSQTGAVKINGRTLAIKLAPDENRVLAYLAERKGEICSAESLMSHIWPNYESDVHDSSQNLKAQLRQTVDQLSKKIEQSTETGLCIQTVDEQGWRLVEAGEAQPIHIVIDENKFQQQVKEIVDSDFFRNLQVAAHRARQSKGES